MKSVILTLLLAIGSSSAFAQVQAMVGYVNTELKNPIEAVQNVKTLNIDVKYDFKLGNGFTLGPAYNYQRAYDVEVIPDSATYPDGIYRDVDIHFGGAELGKEFKFFKVGGGFFLGYRRLHPDLEAELVRKYRGFVEFHAGPIAVRPFFVESEVTGGVFANRATKYGASAGIVLFK